MNNIIKFNHHTMKQLKNDSEVQIFKLLDGFFVQFFNNNNSEAKTLSNHIMQLNSDEKTLVYLNDTVSNYPHMVKFKNGFFYEINFSIFIENTEFENKEEVINFLLKEINFFTCKKNLLEEKNFYVLKDELSNDDSKTFFSTFDVNKASEASSIDLETLLKLKVDEIGFYSFNTGEQTKKDTEVIVKNKDIINNVNEFLEQYTVELIDLSKYSLKEFELFDKIRFNKENKIKVGEYFHKKIIDDFIHENTILEKNFKQRMLNLGLKLDYSEYLKMIKELELNPLFFINKSKLKTEAYKSVKEFNDNNIIVTFNSDLLHKIVELKELIINEASKRTEKEINDFFNCNNYQLLKFLFEEIIKISNKIEKLDKNDEDNENLIIDEKKYIEKLAYGIKERNLSH